MADLIHERTGIDWHGMSLHYSVETEPLGTAGALALAKDFLKSPRVLVMNGDTWLEPDFIGFRQAAENCDCCIASVTVPDASRYGLIEFDRSGTLHAFLEKALTSNGPGPINAGLYLLSQDVLSILRLCRMSLETQILPALVAEERVRVFEANSPFLDIGTPADYAAASSFFKRIGFSTNLCTKIDASRRTR